MNRRKAVLLVASGPSAIAAAFESKLPTGIEQPWLGPDYWANPLQDWRLRNGRIECFVPGADRNVALLTHDAANDRVGSISMKVKLGRLEEDRLPLGPGWAGFRLGIRGYFNDYRDSALFGTGLDAGLTSEGRLFLGTPDNSLPRINAMLQNLELTLDIEPSGDLYRARLAVKTSTGEQLSELMRSDLPADWIRGTVALVCHSGKIEPTPNHTRAVMTPQGVNKQETQRGGTVRMWFRDWSVGGSKVDVHPDRAWGPVLFAMHTVHRGVMKLTAQMAPVAQTAEEVTLETKSGNAWTKVASAKIDAGARTARFRVETWDQSKDTPYRVSYRYAGAVHSLAGTIRKDPVSKPSVVVAGLSCKNDFGFPHADIVRNLTHFRPDLIAFTGDQIYERSAGYGIQRGPLETATLDYLRKWYLLGWEFRDMLKDIPCVCLPDDHDVYHGNLWGVGGKRATGVGQPGQDTGGYTQPAEWVNMVQRTQTSHMPDPFDPTPVDQGISVYYTALNVGGISFAIVEDRKFKSSPTTILPDARIVNGWSKNPTYRPPYDGDVKGASLLGDRQMKFLEHWAADWSGGVAMKSIISQTIFANVATLPPPADTDSVTPGLPVQKPGSYAQGEMLVADHDSNGWPQTPRNAALRILRKCCAFHIAGDQHLGSTIQYGVDNWNDAGWAVCVPAIANIFPRRWFPPQTGQNRNPAKPRNTGEYNDGFGNKVTVHAVFNPSAVPIEPKPLNHRAPGYGIIEFHRSSRKITIANWARWTDATAPGAKPVDGWPISIHQTDNGLPKSGWVLPEVSNTGGKSVVQVIDESNGEIVYTLRIEGSRFVPPVWREGSYTVRTFDPDAKAELVSRNLRARRA